MNVKGVNTQQLKRGVGHTKELIRKGLSFECIDAGSLIRGLVKL